jgi:hypothetical protein
MTNDKIQMTKEFEAATDMGGSENFGEPFSRIVGVFERF